MNPTNSNVPLSFLFNLSDSDFKFCAFNEMSKYKILQQLERQIKIQVNYTKNKPITRCISPKHLFVNTKLPENECLRTQRRYKRA